jgi:predicted phage terminase large subunit-like protein
VSAPSRRESFYGGTPSLGVDVLGPLRAKVALLAKKINREKQARRGGLIEFVRYFWHVLEPNTPLVEGWALYAICEHLEAVAFGEINRLLITVPPGFCKSLLTDVFFPAWLWAPMNRPGERFVAFSYAASLTERDNGKFRDLLMSAEFQDLWGDRFRLRKIGETKVSNNKTGWKLATSVKGVGTGERGNFVILDDPHSIKEAESDTIRTETVRWFREAMSNRLNNMETDCIIVIMQRSHYQDVAGCILDYDMDYCHLSIEMEFDATRETAGSPNEIGWYDPREQAGELAWPERFPERVCNKLRKDIGPYAWCTPRESPILMGDLSMKSIGDVEVGDEVVGFHTRRGGGKRARLTRAKVLGISRSVQTVVKITFASGQTARCTSDHKWWTGRVDDSHREYAPARDPRYQLRNADGVTTLYRVCPSRLPELDTKQAKLAGWLGGFFDGEGSATLGNRRATSSSVLITFTQTVGKNKKVCDRLEEVLDGLGFDFGYMERSPASLSASHSEWEDRRSYYLKSGAEERGAKRGSRLELNQRFLHIAEPTKWRDRIIDATVNARMFTTEERVVSIEPDGVEEVYGLETTTGNYVVWGLASSNSAQYQQSPTPRGGGILKRDWWRFWGREEALRYGLQWNGGLREFPPMELVIGSLDTAYGEKEENSMCALSVFGIWLDANKNRRAMLMHCWAKHLPLHGEYVEPYPGEAKINYQARRQEKFGLVEWVAHTCKRYKVKRLLIEDKTRGRDVNNELRRLYTRENWGIQLLQPCGDKTSRAHGVVPIFTDGAVWAPSAIDSDTMFTRWADLAIQQCEEFPKSSHNDIVDTITQALNWLRENDLIMRGDEMSAILEDEMTYRPPQDSVAAQYGVAA